MENEKLFGREEKIILDYSLEAEIALYNEGIKFKRKSIIFSKEEEENEELEDIKILISVPLKYQAFLEYFKSNFNLNLHDYFSYTVIKEIESRNADLKIF